MNPYFILAGVVGALMWWGIIVGGQAAWNATAPTPCCAAGQYPPEHYQRLK